MKKCIGLWIFIFTSVTFIWSQDPRWYINSSNPTSSNAFRIGGLTFAPPSGSTLPRKDLFIIYSDDQYLSTRVIAGTNYCGTSFTWPSTNTFGSYDLIGPVGKSIKYLYLSNIYQGDDPPNGVSIANQTLNTNSNLSTTSCNTLSSAHDIVKGKDYIVIVPQKLFDSCGGPIDLQLDLNFFKTSDPSCSDIFSNNSNTKWSYHNLSSITINGGSSGSINNIPAPASNLFHFFNFYTSTSSSYQVGSEQTITAKCHSTGSVVSELKDTIREVHDPNFIRVECVYSKSNKHYAKYKLQFMNDGSKSVDWVVVNFKWPSVVKQGSIRIGRWSYGGSGDCSIKNKPQYGLSYFESFPMASFSFSVNNPSYLTAQIANTTNTPPATQVGWVEFCVEVNGNPRYYSQVLQPTMATTNFEGQIYPIYIFKDPHDGDYRRPSNWRNCHCSCPVNQNPTDVPSNN